MTMMDCSNNNDHRDATRSTIEAMCRQEQQGYKTCDYLHQDATSEPSCANPLNASVEIDMDCRTKMAAWCYQVVDFCKFNRETVAIAMNILDRYMATKAGAAAACDRKTYQLAAMTALYTAVKIHEPEAMDPKLISTLSRGTYMPHEVEAMEVQLLQALTWRVNPPTAMAFVRQYLELIPTSTLDTRAAGAVYDLTKFQTELAVSEYDFLNVRPSVVGYCSLMNSLESVGVDEFTLGAIASTLSQAIQLECQEEAGEIQVWLYQAVVQEPAARSIFAHCAAAPATTTNNKPVAPCRNSLERESSHEVSPRTTVA